MNPMFNEYKDAGKIQEALLIGRNMVNKAPGDSECGLFGFPADAG